MINSKSLIDYDKPKTMAQLKNLQKNFYYVMITCLTLSIVMLYIAAFSMGSSNLVGFLSLFGFAVLFLMGAVSAIRFFSFGEISTEEASVILQMAKKFPQVKKYINHLNKKQNRRLTSHEVFMIKLSLPELQRKKLTTALSEL